MPHILKADLGSARQGSSGDAVRRGVAEVKERSLFEDTRSLIPEDSRARRGLQSVTRE